MPGFGYGPFGGDPFGEWGWSRNVLFQTAPAVYREAQTGAGNYLRKFTQGQQPVFDRLREAIAAYDSLRDPFLARLGTDSPTFLTLGKQILPTNPPQQTGVLGRCTLTGVFESRDKAAIFRSSDIGKQLYIRRSSVSTNNQQTFQITGIVNEKSVITSPPFALDAGPVRWEVRSTDPLPMDEVLLEVRGGGLQSLTPGWTISDGKNSYEVLTRQLFYQPVTSRQLVTEREGSDGVVAHTTPGITSLSSASYAFQQQDVGKFVGISEAANPRNNGLWEIGAVEGGSALFGVLVLAGDDNDPAGKLLYGYKEATDRLLTIEHVHEILPSLSLQVALSTQNPALYAVRVRLATDAAGAIVTLPSDIIAAVAADPVLSEILHVARPSGVPLVETEVGEVAQTIVKPPFLVDEDSLYWAMRPFPRVVLRGSVPQGVLDWDGTDVYLGGSAETAAAAATPTGNYVQPAIGGTVTVNVLVSDDLRVNDNVRVTNGVTVTGGDYIVTATPTVTTVTLLLVTPGTVLTGGLVSGGATIRTLYSDRVGSDGGPFLAGDVGKLLTIRGSSAGADGTYIIQTVYDANRVEVNATFTAYESGLYGARRTRPQFIPDPTRINPQLGDVRAGPEAMLNLLAYDFGIEVDTQQTDLRQRSWVRQVSQVSALKGNAAAVTGVAALSGFKTRITELFSIPPAPGMASAYNLIFIALPGRSYVANGLTVVSPGVVVLTTLAATFEPADVGRVVRVVATIPANSAYFVIGAYNSPTQVTLLVPSIGGNLDAGLTPTVSESGPLPIAIGKLYTDSPPAFPRIDDINFGVMEDLYDLAGYSEANRPGIDLPCTVQEIMVGTDPDGYGRATLNCALFTSEYAGVLAAKVVGAGGNNLEYEIALGSDFEFTVTGNRVTTTALSGAPYTYPAQIDKVFSGVDISNVTPGSPVQVTTATPHGLALSGYTEVQISGVVAPTEVNGTWKALRVGPNDFTLWTNTATPSPVVGISPHIGGGTLIQTAVQALMYLQTSSASLGVVAPIGTGLAPEAFTGGLGNTPPAIVTFDPTPGTGGLNITSVTSLGLFHTVTIQGEDLRAVVSPFWTFKDLASGRTYFLDDTPELLSTSPWTFRVRTTAAVAPTSGSAVYFEYNCRPEYSCDSCASNRVAIDVVADKVLNEGATALESAFGRMTARIDEVLPIHALPSYRLRQYFRTPARYSAVPPTPTWEGDEITTFRMVWTDYALTLGSLTAASFVTFKVGLGGYTPEGAIRTPDPALQDLDIIENPARYAADYPVPPYTTLYYAKPLVGAVTTETVPGGTLVRASCTLDFPEYNSDGVGSPLIKEVGIFDSTGQMLAYASFGGVTKVEGATVTLVAELVL